MPASTKDSSKAPIKASDLIARYSADARRLQRELTLVVEERDRLKRTVFAQAEIMRTYAEGWQHEMMRCQESLNLASEYAKELQIQQAPDASGFLPSQESNGHE